MVSKAAERSRRVSAVTDPLAILRRMSLCGHIEKNIIMNVKEGTFSRMVFSISRLEGSHQAGFIKVSM